MHGSPHHVVDLLMLVSLFSLFVAKKTQVSCGVHLAGDKHSVEQPVKIHTVELTCRSNEAAKCR